MFKRNTTRVVTLFAALLVATLVATGAAAAETTISDDSDIIDEGEIDDFNASADDYSILEIETDAEEDTDSLEVMFEAENETISNSMISPTPTASKKMSKTRMRKWSMFTSST